MERCEEEPRAFARIAEAQADAWGGGRPLEELLAAFERAKVPGFAATLRRMLDL